MQQAIDPVRHEPPPPAPHAGLGFGARRHNPDRAHPIRGRQDDRRPPQVLLRRSPKLTKRVTIGQVKLCACGRASTLHDCAARDVDVEPTVSHATGHQSAIAWSSQAAIRVSGLSTVASNTPVRNPVASRRDRPAARTFATRHLRRPAALYTAPSRRRFASQVRTVPAGTEEGKEAVRFLRSEEKAA